MHTPTATTHRRVTNRRLAHPNTDPCRPHGPGLQVQRPGRLCSDTTVQAGGPAGATSASDGRRAHASRRWPTKMWPSRQPSKSGGSGSGPRTRTLAAALIALRPCAAELLAARISAGTAAGGVRTLVAGSRSRPVPLAPRAVAAPLGRPALVGRASSWTGGPINQRGPKIISVRRQPPSTCRLAGSSLSTHAWDLQGKPTDCRF